MQIGLNELLIILFVVIVAYGFYKAGSLVGPPIVRSGGPAGRERPDRRRRNHRRGRSDPATKTGGSSTSTVKDPYVVLNVPQQRNTG